MPTMRDMSLAVLSQRVTEIVDDRGQIGAHGQDSLHAVEQLTPEVVSIARRGAAPLDERVPLPAHVQQPPPLPPPPPPPPRTPPPEAPLRLGGGGGGPGPPPRPPPLQP